MGHTEPPTIREDRRRVTVLFADLADSTAITESLDPEDARDLLGQAVRQIIAQVDELGGTVKDLAGDGVVALFGAPVAHEDDVERAVLCALRVVATVDAGGQGPPPEGSPGLHVRVGVATGEVVVGPVGGGSHVEFGAVGDALNTAARLQAQASPGEVLVADGTSRLVGDRFRWGPQRLLSLKGKAQPVAAVPVLAHRGWDPTLGRDEAPFVGRDVALEGLVDALAGLASGGGRLCVVTGPAGVGKSRLLREARRRLPTQRQGWTWLDGAAASYGATTPYHALRAAVLHWLGLPLDVDAQRLAQAVAEAGAERPAVGGPLADLGPILRPGEASGSGPPERQQREAFAALRSLLTAIAEAGPVVLTVEDVHWADSSTLAFLTETAAGLATLPLGIVVTARPGSRSDEQLAVLAEAAGAAAPLRVDLGPLDPEASRELVRALVGGDGLRSRDERRLLEVTEGNPFFVEEQVVALEATGALVRHGDRLTAGHSDPLPLASTLQHALLAQVDALAPQSRDTLVAASVLGARCPRQVLADVLGDDPALPLTDLQRRDLLVTVGSGEQAEVVFRHALVADAAYATLLRPQRRRLHAAAASALERRFTGRTDEVAAVLGRHHEAAGDVERAFGYYAVAARAAAAAFANEEAADEAARALSLHPPSSDLAPDRRQEVVDLLLLRAAALRHLARYREAIEALTSVVDLTGDGLDRARVQVQIGVVLRDDHRFDEALASFDAALTTLGDPAGTALDVWLDAQLGRGGVDYFLNRLDDYRQVIDEVERVVTERGSRRQRVRFLDSVRGVLWRRDRYVVSEELLRLDAMVYEEQRASSDPEERAWGGFSHAFTLVWHGDLDEAEPLLERSCEAADKLGDAMLRARALTYLMVVARLRGDVAAALARVPAVRSAAAEAALPEYLAMARATQAWASWRQGDHEAARVDAEEAMTLWESLPNRYFFDWMACLPLVALALGDGDVDAAVRWARPMLADSQQPLPDPVKDALESAVQAADSAHVGAARQRLTDAVAAAQQCRRL